MASNFSKTSQNSDIGSDLSTAPQIPLRISFIMESTNDVDLEAEIQALKVKNTKRKLKKHIQPKSSKKLKQLRLKAK